MKILGIESSCDETAAAVVEGGRKICSSIVLSQEKLHRPFKGIVPEIASRAHLENINWVIEKALAQGKKMTNSKQWVQASRDIGAVAVTVGPGLIGSLIVGKMTAQALSWAWGKPLIGINHLEAHLYSSFLEKKNCAFPFLGLIVSGGHTDLILVEKLGRYKILGRTRDDAAGECFDKVANILNLDYPGGPVIDRLAKDGNPHAVPFPRPYMPDTWDFSFSGLKTAVLYYMKGQDNKKGTPFKKTIHRASLPDICASFQGAIVDVLVRKSIQAAKKFGLKRIVIGGGVSANGQLRDQLKKECKMNGMTPYLPQKSLCTDNAAMVASAGYFKLMKQGSARSNRIEFNQNSTLNVNPSLQMQDWL